MKHKAHGLIGFAVLLAAALIMLGCSDNTTPTTPEEENPTAVTLATGSQGTAGDAKITGLAAAKYVVYDESTWYGVKADGTLASPATAADNNPKAAAAAAVALSANTVPITGLINGTTYNVYIVSIKSDGANAVIADSENAAGGNMIVDVSAMVADAQTITLSVNSAIAADASVIFILNGNVSAVSLDTAPTPADADTITTDHGTRNTYTFTATGTYAGVEMEHTVGSPLVTFTKIGTTTTFVLTQSHV